MGTIAFYDLQRAVDYDRAVRFVETGTGTGAGLAIAARVPFFSLWSSEIIPSLAEQARTQWVFDHRVRIYEGPSVDMLTTLNMLPEYQPILFWLDAHFPGADFGLRGYGDEADLSLRLPLAAELAIIKANRPHSRDIIVIDDARIWLDETFEHGPVPEHLREAVCPPERNIDFISDLYDGTHEIRVWHESEGYITVEPR